MKTFLTIVCRTAIRRADRELEKQQQQQQQSLCETIANDNDNDNDSDKDNNDDSDSDEEDVDDGKRFRLSALGTLARKWQKQDMNSVRLLWRRKSKGQRGVCVILTMTLLELELGLQLENRMQWPSGAGWDGRV
ncbi:hypothetical protein AWZ03_004340 [Drosophila navojoa]|uniref:Uncharacterized protein n=1 Tax=Drosophila navojoa TaxID=7232 RepID=A0A484BNE4_DRONA|nr:hypothetical protein AWZ03_004340 [Drosophila navojoa]